MATDKEEGRATQGLLVGGMGGAVLGGIAAILLTKPAAAATSEEKLDYLIELLTALIPVQVEVAAGQLNLIALFEQWLAAQGIEPGDTIIKTEWAAKEPEQIFDQPIRSVGVFFTDKMVDWTKGKRLVFKVESSLDQAVVIQLLGNTSGSFLLPINIGPPLPCAANGNISVGPAWDDWHPFVGATITTGVAPAAGMLRIWAVIQE